MIQDMRAQVEGVGATLEALRAGLTRLEASVLARPLPFAPPEHDGTAPAETPEPADGAAPVEMVEPLGLAWAPGMPEEAGAEPTPEMPEAIDAEPAPGTPEAVDSEQAEPSWTTAEATESSWPAAEAAEPVSSNEAPATIEAEQSKPNWTTLAAEESGWAAAEAALDSAMASKAAPEVQPDVPQPVAEQVPVEPAAPAPEIKKGSLTGWPDESIWSPSFEWKAPILKPPAGTVKPESDQTAAEDEKTESESASNQATEPVAEITASPPRAFDNSWVFSGGDNSLWPAGPSAKTEPDEKAANRDEVARTVAQMRAELGALTGADSAPEAVEPVESGENADDDAARREEVARAVARMRAELGGFNATEEEATDEAGASWQDYTREANGEAAPVAPEDDAARREEVARAIVRLRAEMGGGEAQDSATFEDAVDASGPDAYGPAHGESDEEAVREDVRRAVEAARADLAGPQTPSGAVAPGFQAPPATPEKPRFSLTDWTIDHERDGPPVVVVKDSEGRVELAQVYDALNRIACGDSAALLNYTPHSVTIGLPVRAVIPAIEDMTSAFEAVFGRACRVQSDGARISVSMGTDHDGRSEDAA